MLTGHKKQMERLTLTDYVPESLPKVIFASKLFN